MNVMAWRHQIERIRILIELYLTMYVYRQLSSTDSWWRQHSERGCTSERVWPRCLASDLAAIYLDSMTTQLFFLDLHEIVFSVLWLIKSSIPLRVQFSSSFRAKSLPMRLTCSWYGCLRCGDLVGKRAHDSSDHEIVWRVAVPVRNFAKAVAYLTCIYCVDARMLLWKRLDFLTKLLKKVESLRGVLPDWSQETWKTSNNLQQHIFLGFQTAN